MTDKMPDDSAVICPACAHQFRAIPVSVQRLMLAAGFEPPFVSMPRDAAAVAAPLVAFAESVLESYHSDEGMPEAKVLAREARAALAAYKEQA